jgi:hypothetical protein
MREIRDNAIGINCLIESINVVVDKSICFATYLEGYAEYVKELNLLTKRKDDVSIFINK